MIFLFLSPHRLLISSCPSALSSKMSVHEKIPPPHNGGGATAAAAAAAPARWLMPKFLASALILALLVIVLLDASLLSLGPHRHSPNLRSNFFTPNLNSSANASPASASYAWISAATPANFTSTLLSRWLAAGGDSQTSAISIPGLDGIQQPSLPAGQIHTFLISALDELGSKRCLGGDYFETDLSGESWKSRPPIADHGNGSYSITLQVHPDFAGSYVLTVVLLFRSFQGLKLSPERFKFRRELRKIPISFYRDSSSSPSPELNTCRNSDFTPEFWSGRWTRHARNDRCTVNDAGRYRCLEPELQCRGPWCDGPLGALESNGWVYSAHCSFRIFTPDSAWKCLSNKWLFFWGDSNHVDTIRNLLNFVLGLTDVTSVPRRFDERFTNPKNKSESVRITSVFNGHWNESMNYLGLESLKNGYFRGLLWRYFSEDMAPDVMILNSGLHDGVHWRSVRAFADGADYAARFWEEVLAHVRETGREAPRVYYRTTIAVGGYARDLAFNPSKMEAFNGVLLEKLRARGWSREGWWMSST